MLQHFVLNTVKVYLIMILYLDKIVDCQRHDSPVRVTVNQMIIEKYTTSIVGDVDYYQEYQYNEGDHVKVFCSKMTKQNGQISLSYNYENFTNIDSNAGFGLGFNTYLYSQHNSSRVECRFMPKGDHVRVTFVMKSRNDDPIELKIGGNFIRPPKTSDLYNDIKLPYEYKTNENIDVVFEKNTSVTMKLHALEPSDCIEKTKTNMEDEEKICSHINFRIKDQESCKQVEKVVSLKCSATMDNGRITYVTVEFLKANRHDTEDRCPLQITGLDSKKIYLEHYVLRKFHRIYYNFERDAILNVHCNNTKCENIINPKPKLMWLEGENYEGASIHKVTLTHEHNNTEIRCYLEEEDGHKTKIHRNITVVLREIAPSGGETETGVVGLSNTINNQASSGPGIDDSSDTSNPRNVTEDDQNNNMMWIFIAAGVVTCLVIICVVTAIIKITRRNRHQTQESYKNLYSRSETSIPPYPAQWESNYAVPTDRCETPTYSVPVKPESVYTVPIPKSLRSPKPYEVTYAALDKNSLGIPKNKVQNNDPTYAEVGCYDTKSRSYVNVFDGNYVNADYVDYVEPTYCEATAQKK